MFVFDSLDSLSCIARLKNVLIHEINNPSVIVVDNLDCHVSEDSVNICAEKLGSEIYPLPENTTSYCQPLDVGVMGPLKAKLRTLWLVNSTKAKTVSEKRKLAIDLTIKAFDELSVTCIRRSWEKSFFLKSKRQPGGIIV